MIYMHRPVANCDAEYANKLREGRIDEIRPCCRCLNCLGGLCRVNPCNNSVFTDAMPEGYEVRPADGDKNVMVIGGGPAGMEAARVAAERGYAVTLYEKNGLGGLLDFAEMVKGKHESLGRLRNYLSRIAEVEGVNVVTGQKWTRPSCVSRAPMWIIVATGRRTAGAGGCGHGRHAGHWRHRLFGQRDRRARGGARIQRSGHRHGPLPHRPGQEGDGDRAGTRPRPSAPVRP